MAILVLGGAGYIGSHMVYELIDAGQDVVVADDLSTGFRAAVHPKARFYQLDARNRTALAALFAREKIEGVIHFAAYSQVGESMQDPLKYYDNNLYGTIVLLETMQQYQVDKIVFSSSSAVYGEPEQTPIPENAPTAPTNCYGETKLAMEKMMYWASQAFNLHYAALRYFNACGAHPSAQIGEAHNPESHLLPLVLQTAAGQRQQITIFGDDYPTADGTCIRDYIHVCDLAHAHILALEYLKRGGANAVFNLGNGVGFSVRQIIEAARQVTGQPIPAEIAAKRPGDPAQLVASAEKARQILGWQPKYTELADIIDTAWQWHRSHPNGYAK